MDDALLIAGEKFSSRLFVGTGKYSSSEVMRSSLEASRSEMVTVALKRTNPAASEDSILDYIDSSRFRILPNTSGVRDAKEAIFAA